MYKKRLKKWNIRKRTYRKSQPSSIASSSPAVSSAVTDPDSEDADIEDIPRETLTPGATWEIQSRGNALTVTPSSIQTYRHLEMVLDSVSSWSQNKLESRIPSTDPMSKYLANTNAPPIQDSRTMYRTFELVFDLWNRGKGNLAGMAARKGFYALEFVLAEDHPDLVWHVLDTIYDMVKTDHLQLLSLFLQHANALASRLLPVEHPLFRILHQLSICDYTTNLGREQICHLLRQAWLRNVELLGQQVGSLAPRHLWLYEQLIWDGRTRLRSHSGLQKLQTEMEAALANLSRTEDGSAEGSLSQSDKLRVEALMLEFTQMDLKDSEGAGQLVRALLKHSDNPSLTNARFQAYGHKMLARLYEKNNDLENAEKNYKAAIAKRECAHGNDSNLRVVRDMWVLAAHYGKTGREEDAKAVVADALGRAEQYLNDIPG